MKLISITTAPNCSYQIGTVLTVHVEHNSKLMTHDFTVAYANRKAFLKRVSLIDTPKPFVELMEDCTNIHFDRSRYYSFCDSMTTLHQFIEQLVSQVNPKRISEMFIATDIVSFKVDGHFCKYKIIPDNGGYRLHMQIGPYTFWELCRHLGIPIDIWGQQKEYSYKRNQCLGRYTFSTIDDIYKCIKLINEYFSHENQLCNEEVIGRDDNSCSGCRICCEEDKIELPKSEISYGRILS